MPREGIDGLPRQATAHVAGLLRPRRLTTFITRLEGAEGRPDGVRLAVKDAIDVAGVPTTAGCRAVAEEAQPGDRRRRLPGRRPPRRRPHRRQGQPPRAVLRGDRREPLVRDAGQPARRLAHPGRFVERVGGRGRHRRGRRRVRHGHDGLHPQPVGLLRDRRAQDNVGTTAARRHLAACTRRWTRSVRWPATWPARHDRACDCSSLASSPPSPAMAVGRIRLADTDPLIDAAIDHRARGQRATVVEVDLPGWDEASRGALTLLFAEALEADRTLVAEHGRRLGRDLQARFAIADDADRRRHRRRRERSTRPVGGRSSLRCSSGSRSWPCRPCCGFRPHRRRRRRSPTGRAGGQPRRPSALAQPVPTTGELPASLQLVGPDDAEDILLATGALESTARRVRCDGRGVSTD